MPAAKPVRSATTAKGVKPNVIASFPRTGAKPRNAAELKAARTPAVCFFCKGTSLCHLRELLYQCFYFFEEFIVEEVAFLHEGLNLPAESVLLIRG